MCYLRLTSRLGLSSWDMARQVAGTLTGGKCYLHAMTFLLVLRFCAAPAATYQ